MRTVTTGGTLRLADGRTMQVQEIEQIGPRYELVECQVPDTRWSTRDDHGHQHRWYVPADNRQGDPVVPTATRSRQHVDCDGTCSNWDCDGYTIDVWNCVACGDQIEPRHGPGTAQILVEDQRIEFETVGEPDPDVSLLVGVEASLEFPVGVGEMVTVTGRVWEDGDREVTWTSGISAGALERRRFTFRETETR
jgi:hypothetical protein